MVILGQKRRVFYANLVKDPLITDLKKLFQNKKYLKTSEIFIVGYGAPGAEAGSGEEGGSGDAAARAEEDYAGI